MWQRTIWTMGLIMATCAGVATADHDEKADTTAPIYSFTMKDIDGKNVDLADYKGNVLLIVNVASQCGLTDKNYKGLEPLYQKYKEDGLRILAFPANNFGSQEPGNSKQIKSFCAKYNVTFDLFEKVSVKGDDKCPLYEYLTEKTGEGVAGEIMWNFQKFLVSRDGKVLANFDPRTNPDDKKLVSAIEDALDAGDEQKSSEG